MRIETLDVENFRCFEEHSFSFVEARTLIVGDHEVGKSSTQDAIRWLLTGRCRGLDRGGRGVDDLVRDGANPIWLSVEASVVHAGERRKIARTWDGKSSVLTVEGFQGSTGDQQVGLCQWLGVSFEVLCAVLDGEWFLGLAHAEAKDLVMALLNVRVVVSDQTNFDTETIDLDEVERRYQKAYDERRGLNRDLRNLGAALTEPEPVGDIEGVKARLSDLRQEREKLIAQRGQDAGRHDAIRSSIASLQMKRDALIDEANSNGADVDVVRAEAKTLDELAAAAAAGLASAETAFADAKRASGALDRDELAKIVTQLTEHDPKKGCVLHKDVPCLTKAKEFKTAADAVAQAASMFSALDEAKALVDSAKAEAARAKVASDVAKRRLERVVAMADDIKGLDAEIAALQAQLPAESSDTQTSSDKIAELDDRIQKGEAILQKKRGLEAQLERYEADRKHRAELQKKVEQVEEDVERYGPTGLKNQALEHAKGQFETAINQALAPFGYSLQITIDPWQVLVNGRPMTLLSTSARWRVCVALQIALASMTGVSCTLIDQVELLLSAPRKLLTHVVLTSDLEQVILAKAHEPGTPIPQIGGVQTILLSRQDEPAAVSA